MPRSRTRKLDRNRRRFSIRLSDDQTKYLESLHNAEQNRTGNPRATADLGTVIDDALETHKGFKVFQKDLHHEG